MLKADLNCFNYFRSSNKAVFSGPFFPARLQEREQQMEAISPARVENRFCGGLICQDKVQPTR